MKMHKRNARIVFTGGGTGGHVFPGLAVIDVLPQDVQVCWFASRGGMEVKILQKHSIPYRRIPAGKLRRQFSLKNIIGFFNIIAGFLFSLYYLMQVRPRLVFSKGGYVSVPVVYAARCLHIPIIIHESDCSPGLATKLCLPPATYVCLSWKESIPRISQRYHHKLRVTGNPIRNISALQQQQQKERSNFCLSFIGGSSGAMEINSLVEQLYDRLCAVARVYHQCGTQYIPPTSTKCYTARPFFYEDYATILAQADVIICRAGASMIGELALAGKPAILIPLVGEMSRGEQLENARTYAESGAAKVLLHPDANELWNCISSLLQDREKLQEMSRQATALAPKETADNIANIIMDCTMENMHA